MHRFNSKHKKCLSLLALLLAEWVKCHFFPQEHYNSFPGEANTDRIWITVWGYMNTEHSDLSIIQILRTRHNFYLFLKWSRLNRLTWKDSHLLFKIVFGYPLSRPVLYVLKVKKKQSIYSKHIKKVIKLCPFVSIQTEIFSVQIKYYPVNGLSLFIWENSLRPLRNLNRNLKKNQL